MSDSVRPQRRQLTRFRRPWYSPGKNTGVGCHFLQCMKVKSESEVAQSCLTLSDPMDCSLPGSSVHEIFQVRVLEWGAIAFSEWHLVPRDTAEHPAVPRRVTPHPHAPAVSKNDPVGNVTPLRLRKLTLGISNLTNATLACKEQS